MEKNSVVRNINKLGARSAKTTQKRWWAKFLSTFAETGHVSASAKAAGVHRDTVYNERARTPEFERLFNEAEQLAIARMEDELFERARTTPVHQGSDTLLIFLLKCRAPHKYQDRQYLTHEGRIGLDLSGLSEEELRKIVDGD